MSAMTTIPWSDLRDQAAEFEYGEDENHNSSVTAAWIAGPDGRRKFVHQPGTSDFVEVPDSE